MTTQATISAVERIGEALAIRTHDLGRYEHDAVCALVHKLSIRMTCESWGHKMVGQIPPYGTPEWAELEAAWLESDDDE